MEGVWLRIITRSDTKYERREDVLDRSRVEKNLLLRNGPWTVRNWSYVSSTGIRLPPSP